MKISLFIILALFLNSCNYNKHVSDKPTACISLDGNKRIIYQSVDNKVKIVPSTVNHENVIVKVNGKSKIWRLL